MISARKVIAVLAHPACQSILKHITVKSKGGLEQPLEGIDWPTHIIAFYYKDCVIWNHFCHIFEGVQSHDYIDTMLQFANKTDLQETTRALRVLQDMIDVNSSTA